MDRTKGFIEILGCSSLVEERPQSLTLLQLLGSLGALYGVILSTKHPVSQALPALLVECLSAVAGVLCSRENTFV